MDKTEMLSMGRTNVSINSRDCCAYIKLRDYRLADIPECWYCRYARFNSDSDLGICTYNGEGEDVK